MKQIFLLGFVLFSLSAYSQTNMQEGELDSFKIWLDGPSNSRVEGVSLYVDSRATDNFDGPGPYYPIDNLLFSPTQHSFTGLSHDEKGGEALLVRDTRSYEGKYYVDFPLRVDLNLLGEYKITFTNPVNYGYENKAAVVARLIDTDNSNVFIDLFDPDGYTFEVDAIQTRIDRFIVRIYAACLFKKNSEDNKWENPNNWIGGVPGRGENARIDNCAIIPAGTNVVIAKDSEYTIGTLLNSGEVTIENGAILTVQNETKLIKVDDIY